MIDDLSKMTREPGANTAKASLRQLMRQQQPQHSSERAAASSAIGERLRELIAALLREGLLTECPCTLCYIGTDDEVDTQRFLGDFSRLVVPFVETMLPPTLGLFRYERPEELTSGAFGIWEPRPEWITEPSRRVAPHKIELALLPGVAFDRSGRRLGHGKGFFDRLLPQLPATTPRVALAFSWQIVDSVPVDAHDEPVYWIVTEHEVINARHGGAAS